MGGTDLLNEMVVHYRTKSFSGRVKDGLVVRPIYSSAYFDINSLEYDPRYNNQDIVRHRFKTTDWDFVTVPTGYIRYREYDYPTVNAEAMAVYTSKHQQDQQRKTSKRTIRSYLSRYVQRRREDPTFQTRVSARRSAKALAKSSRLHYTWPQPPRPPRR